MKTTIPLVLKILIVSSLLFMGAVNAEDKKPGIVDVPGLPIAVVEGGTPVPAVKPTYSTRKSRQNVVTSAVLSEDAQRYKIVPGQKIFIEVAEGFSNRIETPWKEPLFISSSKLTPKSRGRAVYITPPDARPIGGFVSNQDSTRVIAVVLVPKRIPPQEVVLYTSDEIIEPRGDAEKWEKSQSYLETISLLMETMAKQELPVGYAVRVPQDTDSQWRCNMENLSVSVPKQVLEGNNLRIIVSRVENQTRNEVEAAEHACLTPGVKAASVWPPIVQPGTPSELYQIVSRSNRTNGRRVRPSITE